MGLDLPRIQIRRFRRRRERAADGGGSLTPAARCVAGQRRAHSNLAGFTEPKGITLLTIDFRPRGLARTILDKLSAQLEELRRLNAADDRLLAAETQASEQLAETKRARAEKLAAQALLVDPEAIKAMNKELKALSAKNLDQAEALEANQEARAAIKSKLEPLEAQFAEDRSMRLGSATATHAADIGADLERELLEELAPRLLEFVRKVLFLHDARHGANLAMWANSLVLPSLTDPNLPLIANSRTRLRDAGNVTMSWRPILENVEAPADVRAAMEQAAESVRIERELRAYTPRAQRLARAKPASATGYTRGGVRGDAEWMQRAQEWDAARAHNETRPALDSTQPGAWSSRAIAPTAPPPPPLLDDLSQYGSAGEVLEHDASLRGD
jgi:hypothetical protein